MAAGTPQLADYEIVNLTHFQGKKKGPEEEP